jgi:CRISPR/Cas system-associated endoribonuclease Cas2
MQRDRRYDIDHDRPLAATSNEQLAKRLGQRIQRSVFVGEDDATKLTCIFVIGP